MKIILFCLFLSSPFLIAQTYHIDLPNLVRENDNSMHIEIFSPSPKEKLIIPDVDTTSAKFFTIFYSWMIKDDPFIDIMVIPSRNGENLYMDINNNEDLRDDGSPFFFPDSVNDFAFNIISPDDPRQQVKILLQRIPVMPDSLLQNVVDKDGNLTSKWAKIWGWAKGNPLFAGKRGSYYFDDRITVRKGTLNIGGQTYNIGIFDWSNNGTYNDSDDVLIVDQNNDGDLSDPSEHFALNDIFTLNNLHFKINKLDKYGEWVELITTTEKPTYYLLNKNEERYSKDDSEGSIDPAIWEISLPTINGDTVSLHNYQGKYLLLNFWGDWCKPCLSEIPFLVDAQKNYASKQLQIVSILWSNNFDNVKKIQREKGMNWPQLLESDVIEKQLKINSWPTNILICPDGKYYRTGGVTPNFFSLKLR